MAAIVKSFAISGVDGYLVEVETDTIYGKPSTTIVGLGDTAVKEARERLQASLNCPEFQFPKMKVVINLAPSDIKKSGSHFDLAMAISLLMHSEQLETEQIETFGFIGELSLNSYLRPCSGVLPMVIAARDAGVENIVVPKGNIREASLVTGINVYGFETLQEVCSFLSGETTYEAQESCVESYEEAALLDFDEVQGQDAIIEYIVVAAAGGHNALMIGAPGCGKSMIAKRIPTILPDLSEAEALETTKIYSVAGLLKNRGRLIESRPFRAPHHNASINSLIGGGNNAAPGEISLAHNGVLFLDEIAEFNKKALDSLRQPMEDKKVTVARVKFNNTYPCNFMLVAAMNPCPCGYYGQEKCRCSDYEVLKYRQRISGPIIDRIDIQKYVQPVPFMELSSFTRGSSSVELREQVEAARSFQRQRFAGIDDVHCNAQMTPALVKEYCRLEPEGEKVLKLAFERFEYSARSFHKFLKVARTFADMEESARIRRKDIAAALMARDLEKEQLEMLVV
ncbi:YifB family Mg chelatase-like AAA ATPase [Dethiobacter alkaliphilus]|uniref:Mg chelatase, subunit ChlI n=1 Tax=Dethiobacter alkaliphilus AHT 1 TaxID=555088 RepID=C0GGN9_DETAL|nr:YifB family Mg chelatase-like AAA ATPase [Dethiobacter alkaliphilus]EEG77480.1 Mg chelatase, subunit ChlI [Dethiobacter alkaliphilus AHT 1]